MDVEVGIPVLFTLMPFTAKFNKYYSFASYGIGNHTDNNNNINVWGGHAIH